MQHFDTGDMLRVSLITVYFSVAAPLRDKYLIYHPLQYLYWTLDTSTDR